MNFARCEQCGAKALIAASQCPRCTHPLHLRDARGEPVPLAHCRKCDTYYPRSLGGCKWCGTSAGSFAVPTRVIVTGVLVVAVVTAVGVWQWRVRQFSTSAESMVALDQVASVEVAAPAPPASVTTGDDSTAGLTAEDSTPEFVVVDTQPVTTEPFPPPARPVVPPPVVTPRADRYTGPWTRGVAQNWVNVRAEPSRDGTIVGVVTPDTPVQLGDERAGWRRVRSAGVEGWADARFFAVTPERR